MQKVLVLTSHLKEIEQFLMYNHRKYNLGDIIFLFYCSAVSDL